MRVGGCLARMRLPARASGADGIGHSSGTWCRGANGCLNKARVCTRGRLQPRGFYHVDVTYLIFVIPLINLGGGGGHDGAMVKAPLLSCVCLAPRMHAVQ